MTPTPMATPENKTRQRREVISGILASMDNQSTDDAMLPLSV
jgi:hypothetical protein